MSLSVFNGRKIKVRPPQLKPATLSDFGGGLNAVDNDLTMKTRFAKVLNNWFRDVDGAKSVRHGTKFKFDVSSAVSGDIVDVVYFSNHLVVFCASGEIASITDAGVITAIWNNTIAAALVGAPSGWGSTFTAIDTTTFKGNLIVVNGVDKPLIIASDMSVNYLQDVPTGSNVNTPIGRYCTTVANYCVIGGIPSDEGTIYISATGTSGTWPGDTAPNDAVSINVSTYAPEAGAKIIALGSFRNNLLVFFDGAMIIFTLGTMNDAGTHVPQVKDTIIEHGVLNHRTNITLKNDYIFADTAGVFSASRNAFSLVDTKSLSDLVLPLYQSEVPFEDVGRAKCFSVWDSTEHRVFNFMPSADGMTAWVMSSATAAVKDPQWSRVTGWNFVAGCTTAKGRMFLAKGSKLFQYGNNAFADENYSADFVGEYDSAWATGTAYSIGDRVLSSGTVYVCLVAHTSGTFATDLAADKWDVYQGEAIDFDWELPWTDTNARAPTKFLAYLAADTQGTAAFTLDVFVDNYYKDADGNYDPALSMDFVAGDAGGYGNLDQTYGGGRRLRDERPFGMPVSFKIMKLRVHGSTKLPLKVVTMTIFYSTGTFKRA